MADAQDLDARPLTPRQAAFVREYILDNNGTQAAIRAGYARDSAGPTAARLIADDNIANAVAQSQAQRLAAVNTSVEEVLGEIKALSNSNIDHYEISDEGRVTLAPGAPANAMSAIREINKKTRVETSKDGTVTRYYDVTVRLWDKPGSLKLMGRHAGVKACFDRVEVTGVDGGPVLIGAISRQIIDPSQIEG